MEKKHRRLEWEYRVRGVITIKIKHYGFVTFQPSTVVLGTKLPISIGDVIYLRLPRPLNGQPWLQLFRIRFARGKPAVHMGKKFGDRWYWTHTKMAQRILDGYIPPLS